MIELMVDFKIEDSKSERKKHTNDNIYLKIVN